MAASPPKELLVSDEDRALHPQTVPASLEPVNGVYSKDVTTDPANKVWSRVFMPIGDERQWPVMLFYHGGGFLYGSADSSIHDALGRWIARECQIVVVSPNYRLAPQFPCPAAYDDCWKALEWLRSPESKAHLSVEIDLSQCLIMGDSAGGNIAHFMGCRAAAAEDISPVQIRGIIELQPFFGGENLTPAEAADGKSRTLTLAVCHELWKQFVPGHNRNHPNINVLGPNAPDMSGLKLPPILVITGGRDILIDRQLSYAKKLQSMGKDVTVLIYDKADHGFYSLKYVDPGRQVSDAMENVFRFARSHVS